jgi:hypothetical protein
MSVGERTDYREENIRQTMSRCVHFTGLHGPGMKRHETCAAGVRYDDVMVSHEPMPYQSRSGHDYTTARSMPCLGGSHNLGGATCAKRCTPTREEAEAKERELQDFIAKMGTARRAIVEHIKAGGRSSGAIPCPCCTTGALGYSRVSSNGHIWAKCSTEGCVSWME